MRHCTDLHQAARYPADVSQLLIEEPELPASQGHYDCILRGLLHKLGIVVPPRFGSIATCYQEEMLDISAFDRVYHGIRYAENGSACEPQRPYMRFPLPSVYTGCSTLQFLHSYLYNFDDFYPLLAIKLVENFGIKPVTTADEDLAAILG